jgi:Ca-activated chloride channel family protein
MRNVVPLLLFTALTSAPALASAGVPDVHRGTLLFRDHEAYREAPSLDTKVRYAVTGMIARAEVTQHFKSDDPAWLDAVYVFPLPTGAAVDHLRLLVGERVIEGVVKEREEAASLYETARREGKKASLLEQERPNIFTTSVANIGPGEEVTVVIEYQEALRYDQGQFSLRFPLVVAPRYIPGAPTTLGGFGANGFATDQVPDAARITPPMDAARSNPVEIEVDLDAGFPIAALSSPSHAIQSRLDPSGTRARISSSGPYAADRDFVLSWRPEVGRSPRAALFSELAGDSTYALLMVLPPESDAKTKMARETIFVIDTSGSMAGASIAQAKASLMLALSRLQPEDSFNVIEFNSRHRVLFGESRRANEENLALARGFVEGLVANGGTEMLPALQAAFDGQERSSGVVRQVIFMTDGEVGNEAELFDFIKRNLGPSRLFTVGIGSAPNQHFMERAARFGRGTFTYVGRIEEVGEKMGSLFQKLESPVLTELAVGWADPGVEVWPARVPDLYLGEPMVIAARLPRPGQKVSLSGKTGGAPWQFEVPVGGGAKGRGIAKLWAKEKITALGDSRSDGADREEVKRSIIAVALQHQLVSEFTSLVAVDKEPSRPAEVSPARGPVAVPTAAPAGAAIAASMPKGGTESNLALLAGALLLLSGVALSVERKRALSRS